MSSPVFNLLNELHNNELLLLEYNKKDLQEIEKNYDDFTFSFEIEMNSIEACSEYGNEAEVDQDAMARSQHDQLTELTIENVEVIDDEEKFFNMFPELLKLNEILLKDNDQTTIPSIGPSSPELAKAFLVEVLMDKELENMFYFLKDLDFEELQYKRIYQVNQKIESVFYRISDKAEAYKIQSDKGFEYISLLMKSIISKLEKIIEQEELYILEQTDEDDFRYGKDEKSFKEITEEYLPNFYRKWERVLTFEEDSSISKGFEMNIKTYLEGYDQAIEYLTDFFEDFENQDNLNFSSNTGLHTNIGFRNENINTWHLAKGLLFLNHDFATKGFDTRKDSYYAENVKEQFKNFAKDKIKEEVTLDFDAAERLVEEFLKKFRIKYWGMNISHDRWIEFRYPGHEVSLESLRNALKYYMYITYLCADYDFKNIEYKKRLKDFIYKMAGENEDSRKDEKIKNFYKQKILDLSKDKNILLLPEKLKKVLPGYSSSFIKNGNLINTQNNIVFYIPNIESKDFSKITNNIKNILNDEYFISDLSVESLGIKYSMPTVFVSPSGTISEITNGYRTHITWDRIPLGSLKEIYEAVRKDNVDKTREKISDVVNAINKS